MVDPVGLEPTTSCLQGRYSTTEIWAQINGACGWIRTNYLRDMSPPLIHMSFTGKKIIWSPTKDSNPHCLIRSQVSCPVRRMGEMGAKAGFEPAISNLWGWRDDQLLYSAARAFLLSELHILSVLSPSFSGCYIFNNYYNNYRPIINCHYFLID